MIVIGYCIVFFGHHRGKTPCDAWKTLGDSLGASWKVWVVWKLGLRSGLYCLYIFIYTYIYTYIYIYIKIINTCTYIYIYTHTMLYTYVDMYAPYLMRLYMRDFDDGYIYIYLFIHLYIYLFIYIYIEHKYTTYQAHSAPNWPLSAEDMPLQQLHCDAITLSSAMSCGFRGSLACLDRGGRWSRLPTFKNLGSMNLHLFIHVFIFLIMHLCKCIIYIYMQHIRSSIPLGLSNCQERRGKCIPVFHSCHRLKQFTIYVYVHIRTR